jgi:Periplasmic binding protein
LEKLRRLVAIGMLSALTLAACTSNDPEETSTDNSDESDEGEGTPDDFADIDGPAPGVTDDSVRIGVNYVDAESLRASGLELDLGDAEAAYQALADEINDAGGIHGRQVELVFAPISPADPSATEAECTRLTEDEEVFIVTGFFLGDSVMCPLEVHDTAVVGGEQSPELVARATAPWITPLVDTEFPAIVTAALHEEGLLDGTVGVFSHTRSQQALDAVNAELEELGVTPVETGIVDAPADDPAAVAADVEVLEQRFEAAGVDTVLLVGASAQDWPTYKANPDYRPDIVSSSLVALQSFTSNEATTDTSVIDGAIAGGVYGPNQAIFEAMADCIATIEATGADQQSPDEAAASDSQAFQAAFAACVHIPLTQAWIEAAGPNLNYGTLEAALDAGFEVQLPGDIEPRTYGPSPAADGDPTAYLYTWDESSEAFIRSE